MTDIEISTEEQDQARKEWEDTTSSVFMGNNPSYVDELVSYGACFYCAYSVHKNSIFSVKTTHSPSILFRTKKG